MSEYATDNTMSEENLCTQCGANMKFSPCCGRLDRLTRELAEARSQRDGLVEYVRSYEWSLSGGRCPVCRKWRPSFMLPHVEYHELGCKLKAALDAARPKPPDPDGTYCDVCGTRMVRSGDEWKCLNCGNAIKADAAKGGGA